LADVLETYKPFNGFRANFVVNLEGSYLDLNGSSRGVSTPEDLALLIHLRKISDVILVSAKSAFSEQLKSTSAATLLIVKGSSPLLDIPALSATDNRVIVLAPENASQPTSLSSSSSVHLIAVTNSVVDRISPIELASAIQSLGFKAPISEFGPVWLRQLCEAGIVDELCLTVTKKPHQEFHEESAALAIEALLPSVQFGLVSSIELGDNLFTRWQKPTK
jgi:riboflavin biosynthesis pyrimidine reductase